MALSLCALLLLSCTPQPTPAPDPADPPDPTSDGHTGDTGDTDDDTTPCAPAGTQDCPHEVTSFPSSHRGDTSSAPEGAWDSYSCTPAADEGGPEVHYTVTVPERGLLSLWVDSDAGADIDVHILSEASPDACLARGHIGAAWVVEAGTFRMVADTWVDGSGTALAGGYEVTFDFLPLEEGPCALAPTDLRMFWADCHASNDCAPQQHTDGTTYPFLHTPSVGEVVLEAHLVTEGEDFVGTWPTSLTDRIGRHYTLSAAASGYAMPRGEPWAPAGEGGSEFGQGATGAKIPAEAEAWYVNMYWRDRPAPGTRMLVLDPFGGRAVVAAGGYETGPGDHSAIGGASEEIHHYLGTAHRDKLVMGFPVDATAPLGPIDCGW